MDCAPQALITIDSSPPTSSVKPLPATSPGTFVVSWTGGAINDLSGNNALGGLTSVTAGNSLSLQNGATLTTTGILTNAGNVSIDATSALTVGGSFIQTAGTTTLNGSLTAPTLVDIQGGALSGTGTVNGNLQNEASIIVGSATTAGTLTVTGNYTQSATGNLTLKVGGLNPGIDFDQFVVGGAATLDGTLTITLINAYTPASGTRYQALTFASEIGTFASLVGDGPLFMAVYDPMDLTLTAIRGCPPCPARTGKPHLTQKAQRRKARQATKGCATYPLRDKKWRRGRAATQAISESRVNVTDPCATFFAEVAQGGGGVGANQPMAASPDGSKHVTRI
jgi:hypothetical protein